MNAPNFEPTFNTLGVFDEESCRFFLRELGERIVPFYPYFVGIEEVYSVLLERYGRAQIADVLSVLHELLEDEAAAGGFGDDGDIWRSWRYSWRHRHDGLLMPSAAKVGNFVLPPPTPLFIRRIKAENFAILYTQRSLDDSPGDFLLSTPEKQINHTTGQSGTVLNHEISLGVSQATAALQSLTNRPVSRTKASSSFRYCQMPNLESGKETIDLPDMRREREEDDMDSEQDFLEMALPSSLGEFDPSLCLSFDMIQSRPENRERRLSLRGGDLPVCKLQQIPSNDHDNRTKSDTTPHTDLTLKKCKGEDVLNNLEPIHQSDAEGIPSTTLPALLGTTAWPLSFSDQVEITRCQTNNHTEQSQSIKSSNDIGSLERSSNRQARLIDGAIFTGRNRKARKSHRSPLKCEGTDMDIVRSSPVRFSWTGSRQKPPLRQSWLSGVRSLWRGDHQNKQDEHHRQPSSATIGSHVDRISKMSPPHRRVTSLASENSGTRQKPNTTYALGLDGAVDLPFSPPKSPANLNKPLPLFPGEKYHQFPISAHSASPSFTHSQGTTYRPSTDSTISSRFSQTSGLRGIRDASRDLLKTEIMSHGHDLSPVDKVNVFETRPPTLSFSSVADANPFAGDPIPLTPSAPAPLAFRKASDPEKGFEAVHVPPVPKLPQSRSEPNMQPYTPRTPKRVPIADCHVPPHLAPFPSTLRSPQPKQMVESPSRGRLSQRQETPAKELQKVAEDEVLSVRLSPQKRSRSPMKRFFRFGKSSSLKDIAGEPQTPLKQTQINQVKQNTGKSWSNKLRHGFLTSDNEEDEEKDHSVTQSPPQQSTFPVSLDPPFQAKVLCELELMLVVAANRFLLIESEAGRISAVSVVKLCEAWASMNRPQVIEFLYDFLTQRELVMANLKTIHLKGECAENPVILNAALYGWKTMAKEMNVRTFCAPDSVIRKWLHDSHKIFEMLGANVQTFFAFQDLQLQALTKINEKHKLRADGKHSRNASGGSVQEELRIAAENGVRKMALSPAPGSRSKERMRVATGAEGVIHRCPAQGLSVRNRDAFENSRGGRLGLKVRDFGK